MLSNMAPKKKYGKLKKISILLLLLLISFFVYVEIANRNSVNMTYRQKFLKAVYPAYMWFLNLTGKGTTAFEKEKITPPVPFYSLKDTLNNGSPFDLATLKGKKVLLVNTASDCGYTNQYGDLEKLYEKYKDTLVVLGFPANDFKEQEKGSDEEIEKFCKLNFGVTFPLMKKSSVIKGPGQNEIFKWLSDSTRNGWNNKQPSWNFSKYLVDEEGRLINFFGPTVQPFSDTLINAIKK
jgi:glutathione peroxidase